MSLANAPTGGRPAADLPVTDPAAARAAASVPGAEAERATARAAVIRGLYAITPDWDDTERLCAAVAAALAGGAQVLQYRHKRADARLRRIQAERLAELCAGYGRPLIINDDLDLAVAVDAAGVHVGRDDADPAAVRAAIGPARLLGVSCYDRFEAALAVANLADYVAFGSVFPSPTKPQAVRAPLALFGRARAAGLRSVAIGGITADNAAQVVAAGADAIAVISDLFEAEDIAARAQQLQALFG